MADQRHRLPGLCRERNVLQDIHFAVIAESDIPELDPACCDAIVFISVLRRLRAAIINQCKHPACGYQCLLENIQVLADLVYRFEKAFHILQECKYHTCSDSAAEAQQPEIGQDQRNRQNTDHADCRPQKQSVELDVLHIVPVVHFVDLLKFIPETLLLVEDLYD